MAAGFTESYIRIWSLKKDKLKGLRSDFNVNNVHDRKRPCRLMIGYYSHPHFLKTQRRHLKRLERSRAIPLGSLWGIPPQYTPCRLTRLAGLLCRPSTCFRHRQIIPLGCGHLRP